MGCRAGAVQGTGMIMGGEICVITVITVFRLLIFDTLHSSSLSYRSFIRENSLFLRLHSYELLHKTFIRGKF